MLFLYITMFTPKKFLYTTETNLLLKDPLKVMLNYFLALVNLMQCLIKMN